MSASDFTEPLSEAQRKQFRSQQAHQTHTWVEQRVWDLCDDITGRGCTTLEKLSDAEIAAYARGVLSTLEVILERFDCKELRLRTLIDGAMGERHHRRHAGQTSYGSFGYQRRMFANLAIEIREHRVAMVDRFETFDYPRWESWRKRVWAIERKGVEPGEWEEFERLQHELNALRSLCDWLTDSEHWRRKNWEWRNTQRSPSPQPSPPGEGEARKEAA